jgi:hypothetical protein
MPYNQYLENREMILPQVGCSYVWQGYPHKCSRLAYVKKLEFLEKDIYVTVKHEKCFFSEKYSLTKFWKLYSGTKLNFQLQY